MLLNLSFKAIISAGVEKLINLWKTDFYDRYRQKNISELDFDLIKQK